MKGALALAATLAIASASAEGLDWARHQDLIDSLEGGVERRFVPLVSVNGRLVGAELLDGPARKAGDREWYDGGAERLDKANVRRDLADDGGSELLYILPDGGPGAGAALSRRSSGENGLERRILPGLIVGGLVRFGGQIIASEFLEQGIRKGLQLLKKKKGGKRDLNGVAVEGLEDDGGYYLESRDVPVGGGGDDGEEDAVLDRRDAGAEELEDAEGEADFDIGEAEGLGRRDVEGDDGEEAVAALEDGAEDQPRRVARSWSA